jgi:branched-chain amino acid aminotransferase
MTPTAEARVSIFDRSFLYGDGLFETLPLRGGKPFRWEQHWDRLVRGAEFVGIRLPFRADELLGGMKEIMRLCGQYDVLARIHVSRGEGPRGYGTRGCDHPTVVLTLFPLANRPGGQPLRWRLITASIRQPSGDRLSAYKHASKLANVVARREAELAGADEALLLNSQGHLTESASGNVFWLESATLLTPPIAAGALAGVTRELVIEIARREGWEIKETLAPADRLLQADGAFLTTSGSGMIIAESLDNTTLKRSLIVDQLAELYRRESAA